MTGAADLAQSDHELLASIVEGSQDAIIGKTLDGTVTSWNPAAEAIFGYSAAEMLGRSITAVFPPELVAEEVVILGRIRRGEQIDHYETVRLHKQGRRIDVSLTVSPIRDPEGRIVGASKIVRDITEQKQLRGRLAEVQNELLHVSRLNDMGQMASAFAHELNQPLTAIGSYLAGARRLLEAGDVAGAMDGCDRAAQQLARAGDVIRRLRAFVSKGEVARRNEHLGVVIEEAATLALMGASAQNVTTEVRVAEDATLASIDRVQIQQVLVNLVRNAAEAMTGAADSRLVISTRAAADGMIEVEVADSGPGLPEEVLAKLFLPFITTKATGMGVGLSLCRSIIESHGGEISAANPATGGAVFRFTVPAGGAAG